MSHPTRQEPDRPNLPRVVAIGVVTLIVFGLGVLSSWLTMHLELEAVAPNGIAIPSALGRSQIGMVDQKLFAEQPEARRIAARKRRQLESWGWVDRSRGRIHVPIEVAMQRIAKGERP